MEEMKTKQRPPFPSRIKKTRTKYGPVLNLLSQAYRHGSDGNANIEVEYDQQWRTVFKAQKMGLVTEYCNGCIITDKGKSFYAAHKKELTANV